METHPVPKNVLNVEFKLFGPLTVNQFFKLVVTALICLVLFVVPVPRIITIPVVVVVALLGASIALLEGFEVKVAGVFKAIFGGTQYVWRNKHDVPEVLKESEKKESSTTSTKKMQSNGPAQLDDISIDKLLDARAKARAPKVANAVVGKAPVKQETDERTTDDFEAAYNENYAGTKSLEDSTRSREVPMAAMQTGSGLAQTTANDNLVKVGENVQAVVRPLKNDMARENISISSDQLAHGQLSDEEKAELIKHLTAEVTELKQHLKTVSPRERKEITDAIKTKFAEIQRLVGSRKEAAPANYSDQAIFGVVVNKQDLPVPGANVGVVSSEDPDTLLISTQTRSDGKFKLDLDDLEIHNLIIKVAHPQFRFPDFKVNTDTAKLPAYKFKAM